MTIYSVWQPKAGL